MGMDSLETTDVDSRHRIKGLNDLLPKGLTAQQICEEVRAASLLSFCRHALP